MRIGAIELASACDNVADVGVAPTPGFSIKMQLARICSSPEQKANFQANSNQVCIKPFKNCANSRKYIAPFLPFRLQKGGDYTLGIFSNKSNIVEYQKGCEHCSQASTSLDRFHAVQTNACTLPGLCWLK